MIARRWYNTMIFGAAASVSSVFFIDFCAAVFRCGCVSLWRGADVHCNTHITGIHPCPWCAHGMMASVIPWGLIVAAQAAVSFWPLPMCAAVRLALAVAAFPVVGAIFAVGYGIATGYWK
jgi:hypothetical protein